MERRISGAVYDANEKGGVVRRPFSTLQAWLIAVSPQPGVAFAIGTECERLDSLQGRCHSKTAMRQPFSVHELWWVPAS